MTASGLIIELTSGGERLMFSSMSSALLWRGLLAIAIGIVSVVWPGITVGAFVILFAVYAFLVAGSDAARALSSDRAGPVAGYLFLALLSFATGLIALLWPGITALALLAVIAVWLAFTGILEVVEAISRRHHGLVSWLLGLRRRLVGCRRRHPGRPVWTSWLALWWLVVDAGVLTILGIGYCRKDLRPRWELRPSKPGHGRMCRLGGSISRRLGRRGQRGASSGTG
jgi:uncharacterized membrane protein HdeD (DUF308 family)